ncbi:MAG: hypothetical protein IT244_06835 [Bacteroidia bacterium]|nr:hypothetical protein [Bacteroidia bacterium]
MGIINLQFIPVVWLDETACMEPAMYWHKTGEYASPSWATPGSDKVFLSYPPLIVFVHYVNIFLMPNTVFGLRLPFLIMHVLAVFIAFKWLTKYIGAPVILATILCSFFLFDKAVFEISRAMRVETIELFLLSLLFLLFFKKARPVFLGTIVGLLLLAHLKEWPMMLAFSLVYLIYYTQKKYWLEFTIAAVLPMLFFLWFIQFNVSELYAQMFTYSSEHAAKGSFYNRVLDYFFFRFYPVYKEQPWMALVHLGVLIIAIKDVVKTKGKFIFSSVFLFTTLVWLFALGPNYRYWIPLYFCGLPILANFFIQQKLEIEKYLKWYIIPVFILLLFPFFTRHALGLVQRPERDPHAALAFLNLHIPHQKSTLVFGEEIGFYHALKYPNTDAGHTIEPDNFSFQKYAAVYFLTHETLDSSNCIATYQPKSLALPKWMYYLGKGGTYSGLKIYQIASEEEWKRVTHKYYQK